MKSPNHKYLPAVDHLRALAALLVLQLHASQRFFWDLAYGQDFEQHMVAFRAPNPLLAPFVTGTTGVSLFMVLSGFIFTFGAAGRTIDYPRFLLNRVLRIYPLVAAITIIAALHARAFSLGGVGRTLLFPFMLSARWGNVHVPIGPWGGMFWTLTPEFQFYLIFPLLLAVARWGGLRALSGLIVATVMLRIALVAAGFDLMSVTYFSLPGRFDQFIVGMIVALCLERRGGPAARLGWLVVPAGLVVLLMLHGLNLLELRDGVSAGNWRVFYGLIEAIAWGFFVFGYLCARANARNGILSRIVCRVGEASFSLYLLHYACIYDVIWHGWLVRPTGSPVIDAAVNVVIFAAVMIPVSMVSYRLIERPFLRWRVPYLDRATGRRQAATVDPV